MLSIARAVPGTRTPVLSRLFLQALKSEIAKPLVIYLHLLVVALVSAGLFQNHYAFCFGTAVALLGGKRGNGLTRTK